MSVYVKRRFLGPVFGLVVFAVLFSFNTEATKSATTPYGFEETVSIIKENTQQTSTANQSDSNLYKSSIPFLFDQAPLSDAPTQAVQLLILFIVVLSVYNLIRFIAVRDVSMLLLALALLGMGFYWASVFDLIDSLLATNVAQYGSILVFYANTVAFIGVVVFSLTYLSTKYLSPGSYTALSIILFAFALQVVLALTGFWTYAVWTQLVIGAISLLLLLIVATISLVKGFPPAYYYLAAHLSLFAIIILWFFPDLELENVQLSQQTLMIGAATLHPILLTLGSEFRITFLKRQKEEAKALVIASHRLARYFPKQLVNKVLSDKEMISLNSRRQMVTVLFTDLSGFTSLTDQLEPERITDMLNQYMTHMVSIINRHDGTLDKFIGDGIMALFGAPDEMEVEYQAKQAVKAALLMHQKFDDLAKRWREDGIDHDIRLRIGIHQDFVTVGNIGSNEYMSYTAIGRGVNLASRLERACTPGKINVSFEVYSHTNQEFPFDELQKKLFKGFKRPHRISELDPWEYFQDDIKSRNKKSKISKRFY